MSDTVDQARAAARVQTISDDKCPRCGGTMEKGKALFAVGSNAMWEGKAPPVRLHDCLKCNSCGHSEKFQTEFVYGVHELEPLTDAQVQAGARPGESWEAARRRLEAARQEGTDTGGIIVSMGSAYGSPTIRPEQLDAVKAYQQLSSREQFESWGFCPETLAAIEREKTKEN